MKYSALSDMHNSCMPNAKAFWSFGSMSFTVRALRNIQPEEQITISYCATLQPRAERQKELLGYSFTCTCSSCSLPDPESARSDIRRGLLLKALDNADSFRDDRPLKEWASDTSLSDDHIIKHSQKIVTMMEEESLCIEGIWTVHYVRLFRAYCALGDREAAKMWAKKVASMMTAFTGKDIGWNKVADAPEKTAWWGLRNKSAN
jgi:SET domain